ncbi:MAG TPA: cupredoxin domain-containing protein [Candidatus Acidoferrales bacterium]|nr:cupredoxin domain-containing protein [Candidatus Acidoferrales bacterium]
MHVLVRNVTAAAAAAFAVALSIAPASVAAHPSSDVVASNLKFTPSAIELHAGETTTLRLTSSEGVGGTQSDQLGILPATIVPGQFVTVKVTPAKAGTHVLRCTITCGSGHADTALTVKVLP